jgi:hypothetical protein
MLNELGKIAFADRITCERLHDYLEEIKHRCLGSPRI